MACLYPGIRIPTIAPNKHQVFFDLPNGSGVTLRSQNGAFVAFGDTAKLLKQKFINEKYPGVVQDVPCGRCIRCRIKARKEMSVRLSKEAELYSPGSVLFLTLTYDDNHLCWAKGPVPVGPYDDEVYDDVPTLRRVHFVNFMKRLREFCDRHFGIKLREYHCGEYGEQMKRPHFHAIIYGLDPRLFAKLGYPVTWYNKRKRLKTCSALTDLWGHGMVVFADATFETMQYVAGYVIKKKFSFDSLNEETGYYGFLEQDPLYKPYHGTSKVVRHSDLYELPFACGSNRPGIGSAWYDLHKEELYETDELHYKVGDKVHTIKPCAYFDRKFDLEQPDRLRALKNARAKRNFELHSITLDEQKINEFQYQEKQIDNAAQVPKRLLKYRMQL